MFSSFARIGQHALVALVVAACMLPTAQAQQSSSYQVVDSLGEHAEAQPKTSTNFSGEDTGLHWVQSIGQSTSFMVTTTGIEEEEENVEASSSASSESQGTASPQRGRGHRGPSTVAKQPTIDRASRQVLPIKPSSAAPVKTPIRTRKPAAPSYLVLTPDGQGIVRSIIGNTEDKGEGGQPRLSFFGAIDPLCNCNPAVPHVLPPRPSSEQAPSALHAANFSVQPPRALEHRGIGSWLAGVLTGAGILLGGHVSIVRRKKIRRVLRRHRRSIALGCLVVALLGAALVLALPLQAGAVTSTPSYHVYKGHLLNSSGTPITTAVTFRFSYWKSSDYTSSDTTGTGAINTGSANYAAWQETQTVTPTSQGFFSLALGSGSTLPSYASMQLSTLTGLYLQVEVKTSGAADTAYELLDVNTSNTAMDRSQVLSVPFAKNADLLDQRDTGTSSGSIAVLGSGGLLPTSTVPGATNRDTFTLDADGSSSTPTLQFGSVLAKTLLYDNANSRFDFNASVRVQGNLTVTGLINGVDISSVHSSTGALKAFSGGALTLNISAGSYRLNGAITNFAGSAATLPASSTVYVFMGSGGLTKRTMAFPTDESYIPIAQVTTSAGGITQVVDRRVLSSDDRERTIALTMIPEFDKASYQADASDNVGQLSTTYDSTNLKNFYLWTSTKSSLQDYDIFLQPTLSSDFTRWATGTSNALQFSYRSTSASAANNRLDISVYDTNGQPVTLSGSVSALASTSWATTQVEFSGTPTWTAGQPITIRLKLSAKDTFQMHVGDIKFQSVDVLSE